MSKSDSEMLIKLENSNMIMFSALSKIVHKRTGCFLSQEGNFEHDEDGKIKSRSEGCVNQDVCFGCVFADIAKKTQKELLNMVWLNNNEI